MKDDYDLSDLAEEPVRYGSGQLSDKAEQPAPSSPQRSDFDASQWTLAGPDWFHASGRSFDRLPSGTYRVEATDRGVFAVRQKVISDRLSILPGTSNEKVLSDIRRFWASKARYEKYGLSYKRGVIFYGPPGSGKSCSIILLCKELLEKHDGLVFLCQNPRLLVTLLTDLRKIEPSRLLIVVMEDVDEIIGHHGEHDLLALLDGETQIDNAVFLASTNFPRKLGARIINRPSRFDDRIFVGMPSLESRLAYLKLVTADEPLADGQAEVWAQDTEGMSLAHLRELVVAVRCLEQDYAEVVERLKSGGNMGFRPEPKRKVVNVASQDTWTFVTPTSE